MYKVFNRREQSRVSQNHNRKEKKIVEKKMKIIFSLMVVSALFAMVCADAQSNYFDIDVESGSNTHLPSDSTQALRMRGKGHQFYECMRNEKKKEKKKKKH
jgi:hypothetical protein